MSRFLLYESIMDRTPPWDTRTPAVPAESKTRTSSPRSVPTPNYVPVTGSQRENIPHVAPDRAGTRTGALERAATLEDSTWELLRY